MTTSHKPYHRSLLSSPPTTPPYPLSPASPLAHPHAHPSLDRRTPPPHTVPAPPQPLPWLWQCHHCHRAYTLDATRVCLDDGHAFCSGEAHTSTTLIDRWHRRGVRKTRACSSEFDYEGWSRWLRWRREVRPRGEATAKTHDCWAECRYPSECKWTSPAENRGVSLEGELEGMEIDEADDEVELLGRPEEEVERRLRDAFGVWERANAKGVELFGV